jgi:hypothetical protein
LPLITGEDLIAMGFSPGPMFKEALSAVEDDSSKAVSPIESLRVTLSCRSMGENNESSAV